MKLSLDQYAHLDSLIHRWEQRSKIVALFTLIIAFACVNRPALLPIMFLVTALLFALSRLPLSFLIERLRYPGIFIIAMVIFIPFVAGETVIIDGGWLSVKLEGCLTVLLILTRFVCILTVSLVLFGTAPFLTTIQSLRSLHLSDIIVDMMLLSYRYLEEFSETLITMERAMQLRGFQSKNFSWRNLSILARLMGSLLVRSYEQSKRVYQAMIIRGYGYRKIVPNREKNDDIISRVASTITLAIAVSLIVVEISGSLLTASISLRKLILSLILSLE
ncbi:cobalt ECF transporter T component CbiQ [Gloeocapsa sp. PCC 73106]|uniref:cobalt ECF transporter T component CbiQ n=1 Tax=Gloeocapsa sp. PCC 73106 TaxID=102232 RepID=UPI0002AC88DE|nr:cobalt ECF transporter T component CbiQ [Gloeocapsa sp. PCC 73106]ELR97583.1 cobalt ABC transporter, permease protein CbiQ [Gloeocapsa sp. PCC 73106]